MRTFRKIALFFLAVLCIWFTGPVNAQSEFEHCILTHMPGTPSDEAARAC